MSVTFKCFAASAVSNASSFTAELAEPAAAFSSMFLMRGYLDTDETRHSWKEGSAPNQMRAAGRRAAVQKPLVKLHVQLLYYLRLQSALQIK